MPKGGPVILQDKMALPGTAVVRGNLIDGVGGAADLMVFETEPGVASEGAFVIIADASAVGGSTMGPLIAPHLNGRVYRLGNRVDGTTDTWELMPGHDLQPVRIDADNNATTGVAPTPRDGKEVVAGGPTGAPGAVELNDVMFFVVGRSLDPNVAAGTERTGTAQDVSAYSTFVNVN
jgi:hypothetical protein